MKLILLSVIIGFLISSCKKTDINKSGWQPSTNQSWLLGGSDYLGSMAIFYVSGTSATFISSVDPSHSNEIQIIFCQIPKANSSYSITTDQNPTTPFTCSVTVLVEPNQVDTYLWRIWEAQYGTVTVTASPNGKLVFTLSNITLSAIWNNGYTYTSTLDTATLNQP